MSLMIFDAFQYHIEEIWEHRAQTRQRSPSYPIGTQFVMLILQSQSIET
jgi:hypothetical protein